MTFHLGPKSLSNLSGVHPDLVRIVKEAIQISAVDFGIAAPAVRTAAEQAKLYAKGRTAPGSIVTWKDGYKQKSNHQPEADGWGHAVDLTPYEGSQYILTDRAWDMYPDIAAAMSTAAQDLGLAHRLCWGCVWDRQMSLYGSSRAAVLAEMEAYKIRHPGRDFLDGPHFQLT